MILFKLKKTNKNILWILPVAKLVYNKLLLFIGFYSIFYLKQS